MPGSTGTYISQVQSAVELAEENEEELSAEEHIRRQKEASEEVAYRIIPSSFSVRISYAPIFHPTKEDCLLLTEKIEFEELDSFLYMDLLRGMAAGHIPRRCQNCGRFFLLDSGYDIRYCTNPAPGEHGKTCRQAGAHKKEKLLNDTVQVCKEYRRVYNRLKTRKKRGNITTEEWNRMVAKAQEIKARAEGGALSEVEWKEKFREL